MAFTAIEFYSGIGGMHYALRDAFPSSCVLAACDINTTANRIYSHNFPKTQLLQNNIQAMASRGGISGHGADPEMGGHLHCWAGPRGQLHFGKGEDRAEP
ncbi:hypothetical protein ANCCEY_04324 [Ancylostoma ceylanicum]|uniref:DNA (cytosine-5-)-methyltransferase n=1 Tax=Ancylostoma ceylanicum TaxID=53326 RepID=A0A0D6LX27_9BILA|nr:hypothetical protein ANCCEY_04324 [Ancylostoma ceylanicum]